MQSQSCIIYNTVKEADNICSLHHTQMKKALVKAHYGFSGHMPDKRFPNAKDVQSMGCVIPRWPTHRFAIVYHCITCDRIKKELDPKSL